MLNQSSSGCEQYTLKEVQELVRAHVRPSDRRVWLRKYRSVFTGAEAATALVTQGVSPDQDHAQALGNQLLREGIIYGVPSNVDGFRPDSQLYRFLADDQGTAIKGERVTRKSTQKKFRQQKLVPFGSASPATRHRRGAKIQDEAAVKIQRWFRRKTIQDYIKRRRISRENEGERSDVVTIKGNERTIDINDKTGNIAAEKIQKCVRQRMAKQHVASLFAQQARDRKEEILKQEAQQMSDLLYEGLDIYDQTYLMRTHKLVFTGEHAVKYMLQHHIAQDVRAALRVGQLLVDYELIYDITGNGIFKNAGNFYRFKVDQDQLGQQGLPLPPQKRSSLTATMNAPLLIKHHLKVRGSANRGSLRNSLKEKSQWNKCSVDVQGSPASPKREVPKCNKGRSSISCGSVSELDDENIEQIFSKMREALKPKTVRYRFKVYQNVYIGEECVKWLLDHTDCRDVSQALELGNAMILKGFLRHSNGHHPLENKKMLYTLNSTEDHSDGSHIFGQKEGHWMQDWRWKLMLHGILSDSGKKIQEQKLIEMIIRKLRKPSMIIQLLHNFRFMAIPIFRFLPDDLYSQAAKCCSFRFFEEGESLAGVQERKHALSIIILGSAVVKTQCGSSGSLASISLKPSKKLFECVLGPADYFGLDSLREGVQDVQVTASTSGIIFEFSATLEHIEGMFSQTSNKESQAQMNLFSKMDSCSFYDVRNYSKAWDAFRAFMEAEWASENTNFIDEVDELKAIPEERGRERDEKALSIYQKYIKPKAEQEVNVTGPQRSRVANELGNLLTGDTNNSPTPGSGTARKYSTRKLHIDPAIFNDCYTEVIRLVVKDNFPRFKESLQFKVILYKLGALKDDPKRKPKEIRKGQQVLNRSKNGGLSMDSVSN